MPNSYRLVPVPLLAVGTRDIELRELAEPDRFDPVEKVEEGVLGEITETLSGPSNTAISYGG